jgi:hypothetical protein
MIFSSHVTRKVIMPNDNEYGINYDEDTPVEKRHNLGSQPPMGMDYAKKFWEVRDRYPVTLPMVLTGLDGLTEEQVSSAGVIEDKHK